MPDARSTPSPQAGALSGRVAVLLPLPLSGPYDYLAREEMRATPGAIVRVPLGRRMLAGVVWGEGEGHVDTARLRPIEQVLDAPPLPEVARRFIDWVADYTVTPPGAVLRMTLASPGALEPPKQITYYRLASPPPELKETAARRRVMDAMADSPPRSVSEIAREAGCGLGVVRGLIAQGALEPVTITSDPAPALPDPSHAPATLDADQTAAADALRHSLREGGFSVTVLDGVTGSGKTHVYLEAIAAALEAGRQVLVLLPEIALSTEWLERFTGRFGVEPQTWHSDLTAARRRETWRQVARGTARVVVGARSALFLPFPDLGLIVVDEEHDSAFKQEDGVLYHARDMAVVRARLGGFPIVLVSATPSVETVVNAELGRYERLSLPDRFGGAALPAIELVDMRARGEKAKGFIAPPLVRALEDTIEQGEQALLFLNRRGYAPLTLCSACGHRFECRNCSAWLVDHRLMGQLVCHHCGHAERRPTVCPECAEPDSMIPLGPGVERIAEELEARMPEARWAVVTSDTVSGPKAMANLAQEVRHGTIDILIGTQMLAKGHHFPKLTLVGVVDADLGFNGGDFRAFERTYQLLHQVAGRAGRAERPGRALLQTFDPEHPVLQSVVAGDRDGFLAAQVALRRQSGLPPFTRLAALIVSGPDRAATDALAQTLAQTAPRVEGVEIVGPAEAPLGLLRGRYRRRLLVRAQRRVQLQALIRDWLAMTHVTGTMRVTVDIDPQNFL